MSRTRDVLLTKKLGLSFKSALHGTFYNHIQTIDVLDALDDLNLLMISCSVFNHSSTLNNFMGAE